MFDFTGIRKELAIWINCKKYKIGDISEGGVYVICDKEAITALNGPILNIAIYFKGKNTKVFGSAEFKGHRVNGIALKFCNNMGIPPQKGSGNVADIGIEEWQCKVQLAAEIINIIKNKGWTQTEAIDYLGITEVEIFNINQCQLNGFTIDSLIHYLLKLNRDIYIMVVPIRKTKKRGFSCYLCSVTVWYRNKRRRYNNAVNLTPQDKTNLVG